MSQTPITANCRLYRIVQRCFNIWKLKKRETTVVTRCSKHGIGRDLSITESVAQFLYRISGFTMSQPSVLAQKRFCRIKKKAFIFSIASKESFICSVRTNNVYLFSEAFRCNWYKFFLVFQWSFGN